MAVVDVTKGDKTIAVTGAPCAASGQKDHDPNCPACADGRMFFGPIACRAHGDGDAGIGYQPDCRACELQYRETRKHVVAILVDRGADL